MNKNINVVNLVLDEWLREILVDPISKTPFQNFSDSSFRSSCGFVYDYKIGVPDFRVDAAGNHGEWVTSQQEFETWFSKYLDKGESDPDFYIAEALRDAPLYQKFGISSKGRLLDVGGQLGHIRKFLAKNQEYCSIDPFILAYELAANRPNLFSTYPLSSPLNLIAGFAEFLPFASMSFQVVNMRSCLDHFFSPRQALLEAYRVLRPGGYLIIGLTLEGQTTASKFKDLVRPIAATLFHKFKDHHMWHPTYANLHSLTKSCGFSVIEETWQTPDILYAIFSKNLTHRVSLTRNSLRAA